jgi:3-hydroxyisobutyrate dehydrogenase-like beta-hydroxyacid dehydrogenase
MWTSAGRSPETCARAAAAGLDDVRSLGSLVEQSYVLLSVCPPHAAVDLAYAVAKLGFCGTYVDANAVSPATAREIGRVVEEAGATFVDGGVIGPPAHTRGSTRLYLSGSEAARVAALFEQGPLEAIVLDGPPGAASALKMAFASYTKGTSALLVAVRALAIHEGVDDALLREWERSLPDLPARSQEAVRSTSRKAWRFVGEMKEIAATFASAGLPNGFHCAAAELYLRMARYKDAPLPPSIEEVATSLLER